MTKPAAKSRIDFHCPALKCGHHFSLELTKAEFIDNDHLCPECETPAKRAMFSAQQTSPIPRSRRGSVIYPYHNWQLPVLPGMKPGEQIVKSRQHENEIMRGAWGNTGQKWERNAI